MAYVNSLGRWCCLHLIVTSSRSGEQEQDSILIFPLSHQSLWTLKHTPPPFFLPESSVLSDWYTENESPGWDALSGIPGFSQVLVKQRTLQFLISRWILMMMSSSLSNACTLASRKLGREDPCGLDLRWCSLHIFLSISSFWCCNGCTDGQRDGLVCLCSWGCSWCFIPSTFSSMFTSMFTFENLNQPGTRIGRRANKLVSWPFPNSLNLCIASREATGMVRARTSRTFSFSSPCALVKGWTHFIKQLKQAALIIRLY